MATKTRLLLILLLSVALVLRMTITNRSVQLLPGYTVELLPRQLNHQAGFDIPLTRVEVDLLAPDGGRIAQRGYGQGDTTVWLAAVQSRDDWRVQHPPQVCYTAQGWHIEEQAPRTLRDTKRRAYAVQRMLVSKEGEHRVVYYFYTDGRHWTASYFSRVMYAFLDRAVFSQSSTWVLIQISTPLSSPGAEKRVFSACLDLFSQAEHVGS